MIQPKTINVIKDATVDHATSWVLTASDVAVNTQTIVIGGITFTTVDTIGTTAGNVLIGANYAATLTNLATLINDPTTTTATGVALSQADAFKLQNFLGITAVATTTTVTITSSTKADVVVSETETNWAWTSVYTSAPFVPGVIGKCSLQLTRSSHSAGSGTFVVQGSNDGSNWVTYNRITTNATNTNSQTDTRVASVALSSDTSSLVTLPDMYAFFRVVLTIVTDGKHQCNAYLS